MVILTTVLFSAVLLSVSPRDCDARVTAAVAASGVCGQTNVPVLAQQLPAQAAPGWVTPVLISIFGLLAVFIIVTMVLRSKMKATTDEISRKNEEIREKIIEQRHTETMLADNEALYRMLFESSPESITLVGLDGTLLECNAATERIAGVSKEQLIGQSIEEISGSDEEKKLFAQLFQRLLEGQDIQPFEMRIKHIGILATRILEVYPHIIKQEGRPSYILVIARDITDRTEMEERIRQMQKMDAVGTLAGGIAHDFNNLLTGILGYANMLKLSRNRGDNVYHAAEVIENAADRASKLTTQLLGFARMGKRQNVKFDVRKLIQDAAAFVEESVEGGVKVSQKHSGDPILITGDSGQIRQVVLNLALNAQEAMPEGGEIIFETASVDLGDDFCRMHSEISPGRYAMISVTDTGRGIRESIRHRIFEPFFTTKHKAESAGMGLALVYGYVKNHNGAVEVESKVGVGTTIKVFLPSAETAELAEREHHGEKLIRGSGCVMVIDDEDLVLKTASIMLENLGYNVVSFDNGRDAAEHYREHCKEIDLVLLDLVMPGMSGGECYHKLKETNPAVKVVLSSGYGLNVQAQKLIDEGVAGFIQKPYLMVQLSQVVSRALSEGQEQETSRTTEQ